jgi:iron complex outermembrane receptor protein
MRQAQFRLFTGLSWLLVCAAAAAQDTFLELDLKDVLNVEITSVSKKPQTVSKAAAAVFVITSDDIRRMGVQTIPDALRMAPGISVAQISASAWAVTARGFNGRFANKLLVLIDGRTVFSPAYSGVFWDVQDTVLADIERIEVIRGPGAATWGANAVNGVVNIITKSAAASQGGLLEVSSGTAERGTLSMRYGGKLEDLGSWRLYAKSFDREGLHLQATGQPGFDPWRQQRLGARADLNPSTADAVMIQAEIYQGRHGESAVLSQPGSATFFSTSAITQAVSGGHLLLRWQRELEGSNSLTVQSYLDQTVRDWPSNAWQRINTFDTDLQYRHRAFSGHDLVLGLSYRRTQDTVQPSTTGISADTLAMIELYQPKLTIPTWSLLAQDDITLRAKELILTLGARLEQTGDEPSTVAPNARLLWMPSEDQSFWGMAGSANRSLSRTDSGGLGRIVLPASYSVNGNALAFPAFLEVSGERDPKMRSAYELGWKQRWAPGLTTDLSAYANNFSRSSSGASQLGLCRTDQSTVAASCFYPNNEVSRSNSMTARSQGLELAADWQVSRQHRLQASLTRFAVKILSSTLELDAIGTSPNGSGSLRWSYTPNAKTELDLTLRQVGRLNKIAFGQSVPGYQQMDLRWARRTSPTTQWELVGRNLLGGKHLEFVSETGGTASSLIGASINLGLRLQF